MNTHLVGTLGGVAVTMVSIVSHAAALPLESRLGGLAYYDPNLDITWVADANINSFNTWENQGAWVAGLTIGNVSGWRLPSADVNGDDTVVDCSGGGVSGCADNEMGYLFWERGITPAAPGPFSNVQSSNYWSGTEVASSPTNAWSFGFNSGSQVSLARNFANFAWAVRDGDAAPPTPEEQIAALVEVVMMINLHSGISNSFDAKLDAMLRALEDSNVNDDVAALNSIYAFCSSVAAQRGKKLSSEDADTLLIAANGILASLDEFASLCE